MDNMRSYESEWKKTGTGGEGFPPPICLQSMPLWILGTPSNQKWGTYDVVYFNVARSSSITSEIQEMLAELDETGISVPDPKAIRDYLIINPDVTDFISRVSRYVWSQLGARSRLSLELYIDCEIDDQYPTLYVRQNIYDEDLLDAIDEAFDPFMDDLAKLNGWLLVTTDFKRLGRER